MIENNTSNWLKLVDEESGLYNRLFLIHHLSEAFARARRYSTSISCLLIRAKWWQGVEDIPRNDEAAVSALQMLARFLLLNVRTGDILGRWARDEFLLVTSGTPPEGMHALIKIIAAKAETFGFDDVPDLAISVHAGVAGLPGDDEKLRHAEAIPLLAQERLTPVFWVGRFNGAECSPERR